MHLYKKVYLPIELVGVRGNKQTKVFNEIKALSPIEWNFKFPEVPIPKGNKIKAWNSFKQWLR